MYGFLLIAMARGGHISIVYRGLMNLPRKEMAVVLSEGSKMSLGLLE